MADAARAEYEPLVDEATLLLKRRHSFVHAMRLIHGRGK
jgi:hypothetical protein